jgi:hypothetical protein
MWNTYNLHCLWIPCNYCNVVLHKTMGFLCCKHSHSHVSFKNNVHSFDYNIEYIQILFILTITWNSCNFFTNLWSVESLWWCGTFCWTWSLIHVNITMIEKLLNFAHFTHKTWAPHYYALLMTMLSYGFE